MIKEAKYFRTGAEFYKWLEKNHEVRTELTVGFYKVGTNKKSMKWADAVDQALCFGWIDSVRQFGDEESYTLRFTPRKPKSTWSEVNIKKMERLIAAGMVYPKGMEAFERRHDVKAKSYAHENEEGKLSAAYEKKFRANKKAWTWFTETAPPYYRKFFIHSVMSAKQEETRERRLSKLIEASAEGKKLSM